MICERRVYIVNPRYQIKICLASPNFCHRHLESGGGDVYALVRCRADQCRLLPPRGSTTRAFDRVMMTRVIRRCRRFFVHVRHATRQATKWMECREVGQGEEGKQAPCGEMLNALGEPPRIFRSWRSLQSASANSAATRRSRSQRCQERSTWQIPASFYLDSSAHSGDRTLRMTFRGPLLSSRCPSM